MDDEGYATRGFRDVVIGYLIGKPGGPVRFIFREITETLSVDQRWNLNVVCGEALARDDLTLVDLPHDISDSFRLGPEEHWEHE